MPLTNHLNLPPATVVAILMDDYDKGDARYSITELIRPPQMGALMRAYSGAIVEDVSDRLPSLYGQLMHYLLEQAGKAPREVWENVYNSNGLEWNYVEIPIPLAVEERFTFEVSGVKVSGKPDSVLLYPDRSLLEDYKLTMVYQVTHGPSAEWVAQANLYRLGLSLSGSPVPDALQVQAHMKDWSIGRAEWDKAYPQHSVALVPIPVWPLEQTQAFLEERVRLHVEADAALAAGDPLVPCTDEERWTRPTKWAVTSAGRARALRVYDNADEAGQHAATSDKLTVEVRPGLPRRCSLYCGAGRAGVCQQWEAEKVKWAAELEGEGRSSVE